jgi:spore maturation protein CgeB
VKWMVVGPWQVPWYQERFANALRVCGMDIVPFSWATDFWENAGIGANFKSTSTKIQYRSILGPKIAKLQNRFLAAAIENKPDVIFFYGVQHIRSSTIRKCRLMVPGAIYASYHNDNPFSPNADWLLWREVKRSIIYFDIHFVYRTSNLLEMRKAGASNVKLLRSYFIPEDDFSIHDLEIEPRFKSDVVFVGHYENDGRIDFLESIASLGINLKLFGGGWGKVKNRLLSGPLASQWPVTEVTGADYRKAICGTKIALCFLSKLNRDTYTRRNFQIPAMCAFQLSEYTEDLADLFIPDHEIVLFKTKNEMLEKISEYLTNSQKRKAVAKNGNIRVIKNGHDIQSRAFQTIQEILAMTKFIT